MIVVLNTVHKNRLPFSILRPFGKDKPVLSGAEEREEQAVKMLFQQPAGKACLTRAINVRTELRAGESLTPGR
jgi:hypothetical protein